MCSDLFNWSHIDRWLGHFSVSPSKITIQEHLTGSRGRTHDSWPWGCKFEPYVGDRDYLKTKIKKKIMMQWIHFIHTFEQLSSYFLRHKFPQVELPFRHLTAELFSSQVCQYTISISRVGEFPSLDPCDDAKHRQSLKSSEADFFHLI